MKRQVKIRQLRRPRRILLLMAIGQAEEGVTLKVEQVELVAPPPWAGVHLLVVESRHRRLRDEGKVATRSVAVVVEEGEGAVEVLEVEEGDGVVEVLKVEEVGGIPGEGVEGEGEAGGSHVYM